MAASTVHVNGYTVIRYKYNETSSDEVCRYFYLSEHKVRMVDQSKPLGRTLFILNVPPFCKEESIGRLFEECGTVERVQIQDKPLSTQDSTGDRKTAKTDFFTDVEVKQGYKVAYVVFKKKTGVKAALQLSYQNIRILFPANSSPPEVGLQKWCNEYIRRISPPDSSALQNEIDVYMAKYDSEQAKRVEEELRREQEPDEEGWVTVSKHGKRGALPRSEAHQLSVKMKDKKRSKDKELLHFYAYQVRESKKEYVAQLRQKFEEDKQRIALMKASRKFRPY